MIRFSIVYLLPTYPTRLMAVWQVTQQRPFELLTFFTLVFEVLFRTAVLVGLLLFAYRLVQGTWSVLKFLVQVLIQKFQKVFTVESHGVGPASSSRR